jgi:hypothetical protein
MNDIRMYKNSLYSGFLLRVIEGQFNELIGSGDALCTHIFESHDPACPLLRSTLPLS